MLLHHSRVLVTKRFGDRDQLGAGHDQLGRVGVPKFVEGNALHSSFLAGDPQWPEGVGLPPGQSVWANKDQLLRLPALGQGEQEIPPFVGQGDDCG